MSERDLEVTKKNPVIPQSPQRVSSGTVTPKGQYGDITGISLKKERDKTENSRQNLKFKN